MKAPFEEDVAVRIVMVACCHDELNMN